MKTEIIVFKNELFGQIRAIQDENNEAWFAGRDVAKILGYSNPNNAITNHVDDEDKTTYLIQVTGSNYKTNTIFINESGLYSLILSSKLPDAKKFKRWVTSSVLPQIRKTGGYIPVNAEDDEKTILAKAMMILNCTIEEKNSIIQTLEPKARLADQMLGAEGSIYISEMAKLLHQNGLETGPKRFFKWLREKGYLFKYSREPLHKWVEKGIFCMKLCCFDVEGETRQEITTMVTPKGQQYFLELLAPHPSPPPSGRVLRYQGV